MTVCCRCNSVGRCKNCSCVKRGSQCVNCLPVRSNRCANCAGPAGVDSVSLVNGCLPQEGFGDNGVPTEEVEPTSSDNGQHCRNSLDSHKVNICGICDSPISVSGSNGILCTSACEVYYHCDCVEVSTSSEKWVCLQCLIMQGKQIRVLRYIPKGARIQTALGLSRVVQGCVQQPTSILSWRKLFSFASTALRVPRVVTISKKSKIKISLTTAVKHQVEAFTEGLCPPYPTPEAARSQSTNQPKKRSESTNQPKNLSEGHKLRKLVELKIADGDVTGAIRLLSSKTTVAPFNAATAAALHEKHPIPPDDLKLPPATDLSAPALEVSTATIEKSIRSFKPGSAAGPDKLSPQHLKELISRQNGESGALLLDSLAALANVMLAGIVPAVIQTILYGANLLALHKPGGG